MGRVTLGLFAEDNSYTKLFLDSWDSLNNFNDAKAFVTGAIKATNKFNIIGGAVQAGVCAFDAWSNWQKSGEKGLTDQERSFYKASAVQSVGEGILSLAPAATALGGPIAGGIVAGVGGAIYLGATAYKWYTTGKLHSIARGAANVAKSIGNGIANGAKKVGSALKNFFGW